MPKIINTGVESTATPSLSAFLGNTFGFTEATANIKISRGDQTASFSYIMKGNHTGDGNNTFIIGTPSSSENAQAGWKILTSGVYTKTQSSDDSFISFKKGSYIQYGNEKLVFDMDADFLKEEWEMSSLFDQVRAAVHVEEVAGISDEDIYKPVIYLPAGSTLAVGNSVAKLDDDCTINIDASNASTKVDKDDICNTLSTLRDDINSRTTSGDQAKIAIADLMAIFDRIVGIVDEAETVNINVSLEEQPIYVKISRAKLADYTEGVDYTEMETEEVSMGDVNKDGSVCVSDVTKLVNAVLGNEALPTRKVLK